MTGSAFRAESDEGRGIVLEIDFTQMETSGIDGSARLRLTNDEAAELLELLDGEIGDWTRERNAARAVYALTRAEHDDYRYLLDPSDPKHPDYAETLAELGDDRRKTERESM
jgi:hypothetical protein